MPVSYKIVDYTCQTKYIHYIETMETGRMSGTISNVGCWISDLFAVMNTRRKGNGAEKELSDK